MHSHLTFLFVCAFLTVDSAVATPIPALMRPSGPAQFGGSHAPPWHAALQEWAYLCIFVSALLFSIIGTFVLTTFARARASSFADGFSVGATSHCPLRQLYALRVPSPFTAPGGGRGASRRSRVAMRRPVAYPIAAGRRWYPAQSQSHRISAV